MLNYQRVTSENLGGLWHSVARWPVKSFATVAGRTWIGMGAVAKQGLKRYQKHAKNINIQRLCFFSPPPVHFQLFGRSLKRFQHWRMSASHTSIIPKQFAWLFQSFYFPQRSLRSSWLMLFLHLIPFASTSPDGLDCTSNPKPLWPVFWDGKMLKRHFFVWFWGHNLAAPRGLRRFLPAMHAPCHAQWFAPTSPWERGRRDSHPQDGEERGEETWRKVWGCQRWKNAEELRFLIFLLWWGMGGHASIDRSCFDYLLNFRDFESI